MGPHIHILMRPHRKPEKPCHQIQRNRWPRRGWPRTGEGPSPASVTMQHRQEAALPPGPQPWKSLSHCNGKATPSGMPQVEAKDEDCLMKVFPGLAFRCFSGGHVIQRVLASICSPGSFVNFT